MAASGSSSSAAASGGGNLIRTPAPLRLNPVYVPLLGGQEAVKISLLETDVEQDLSDMLRLEQSLLGTWRKVAVEYYKRGLNRHAMHVLLEGTKQDVEDFFADEKHKADRVAMLNTLAAIHTQEALQLKNVPNKTKEVDAASSHATQYWNRSSMLDAECPLTWVGKGLLQFVRGKYDEGEQFFKNAISFATEQKKDIIPAYLGRAIILFHKNPAQYKEAILWFKRALDANPMLPAACRLGLAMCYIKLKDFAAARLVYERILSMDGDNVDALMGLATLELNSESPDRVQKAMSLVAHAHSLNPQHPFVQLTLANHLFFTGAYSAVQQLANAVKTGVETREFKAEASFQLARCFHVRKEWTAALKHYSDAYALAPSHILLNYNYAQVLYATKEYRLATTCMEKVYAEHKTDFNVLLLLGNLYAVTGDDEKARKLLKQASDMSPNDVDLLLELFHVSQRNDPATAFDAMLRVTKLLPAQHKPVPPELWNNLGVVAMALNKPNNASHAFRNALRVIELDEAAASGRKPAPASSPTTTANGSAAAAMSDKDEKGAAAAASSSSAAASGSRSGPEPVITARNVTIQYNLATLYEKIADGASATALYQAIIARFPEYTDARLRLGVMELRRGQNAKAIQIFSDAVQKSPNSANAYSYLGLAHLEEGDNKQAMKQFNHILKSLDKSDVYSKLMLGQIHTLMSSEKSKAKNQLRLLDKAGKYYRSVLAKDARNVYAANGLGVVLSGRGRWADSKAVFTEIKEIAPEVVDVWLNLAHVFTHQSFHLNAVKLYEHVLKRFTSSASSSSEETVNVLLYLANAYFQVGGQLANAKKCLLKAIHLSPDDLILWYNLGLAQEDFAVSVLQMSMTNRTYKEVEHAVNELKSAKQIFERLESTPDIASLGVEPDKAKVHAKFCATTLEVALPHLEHARKRESEQEELRVQSEQKRDEIEVRARAEREAKEAKEREEKERLEELAKQKKSELAAALSKWESEKAAADDADGTSAGADDGKDGITAAANATSTDGKKKSKSKRKKAAGEEEFEDGDELDGAADAAGGDAAGGKKKRKQKKDKSSAADASATATGDAAATTTGAGAATETGDAAAAAAGGSKKRRLKKAGGDSDDEKSTTPTAAAAAAAVDESGVTEQDLFGDISPTHAPASDATAEAPAPIELPASAAPATASADAPTADAAALAATAAPAAATDTAAGGEAATEGAASTGARRKVRIVEDSMDTNE